MTLGSTILRTTIGGLFAAHGAQKLFGVLGGHGLDGTGQFFESVGLTPGRPNAIAAGASELGGGTLLAAGVATPVASAALSGTMVSAIRHVHGPNGPWATDGGYEYNGVLLAALLALTNARSGPKWALAALGAGAAGSFAVSELGRRYDAGTDDATAPTGPVAVPDAPELSPAARAGRSARTRP